MCWNTEPYQELVDKKSAYIVEKNLIMIFVQRVVGMLTLMINNNKGGL